MSLQRMALLTYWLYGATTVFQPKIPLPYELSGIYFFEPVYILLSILLFIGGKLQFGAPERIYLSLSSLSLITWLAANINLDALNLRSLLLLIKFSFYAAIPAAIRGLRAQVRPEDLTRLIAALNWFTLFAAAFVIFNIVTAPVSIELLIGGYDYRYRSIGFSGHTYSAAGLVEIGHTSVQMGVFMAILSLIALAKVLERPTFSTISWFTVAVTGMLLTYSRSGLVAFAIGAFVSAFSRSSRRNRILISVLALGVAFLMLAAFTDALSSISSFGTFSKVGTQGLHDSRRLEYWHLALKHLEDNPLAILVGTGYGTIESIFGFGTLESLVFDTLFENGLLGLLILLAFFHSLWAATSGIQSKFSSWEIRAIMNGLHWSIPGLFFSCLVGGNTLQTDFIAPALFLAIGLLSVLTAPEKSSRKT